MFEMTGSDANLLTALMIGVGLSASCGFRVFVPLLAMGLAGAAGEITLSDDFAWVQSTPVLIGLGIATLLEVGAYYVPWIDNMLDTIAGPSALVAGTVATAAVMPEMSPMLEWSIAAIVGGGSAGVVQLGTTLTRGASTATTGGLGNPLVSTAELGGAAATASLAIFIPILAFILVTIIFFFAFRAIFRFIGRRMNKQPTGSAPAT